MKEEWEDVTSRFEARKVSLSHTKDGIKMTLVIHPDEMPEEILRDFIGTRYLVVLVRLDDNEEPVKRPHLQEGAAAVASAGMLAADPGFQEWLCTTGKIEDFSEEAAASFIRETCGVASRSDLKVNKPAREKFAVLKEEFLRHLRDRV
jgi:hypothetical protein